MKKEKILEEMRNQAVIACLVNYNPIQKISDSDILFGELAALKGLAQALFGTSSEEYQEFKYYADNIEKPFPQPMN